MIDLSGEDTFKKAERIHQHIEKRYRDEEIRYKNDITLISDEISKKLLMINYNKQNIYEKHFLKFTKLANKLHNLTIHKELFLEYFDSSTLKIDTLFKVRKKDELFKIDFNKLSFMENFIRYSLIGFIYTNKKANETLQAVKEEKLRVNEEVKKMRAQVTKARVVLESITNIEEYFSMLIINYEKLLLRFEYGIKTQMQKNILNNRPLIDGKLNFKLIPIAHIEEFQALFNLSIVLKKMSSLSYLTEKGEKIEGEFEEVNNIKRLIEENNLLAS